MGPSHAGVRAWGAERILKGNLEYAREAWKMCMPSYAAIPPQEHSLWEKQKQQQRPVTSRLDTILIVIVKNEKNCKCHPG